MEAQDVVVGEGGEPGAEVAPDAPVELFNIEVLRVIKEAQNSHGLRYGDYQRYRQYCSRRLRRIRKSLRLQYPKQGKWAVREITPEQVTSDRHLLLSLYNAERAWSYAMQLREDNPDGEPRKHYHLLRRLIKAVALSKEFEALASVRGSTRTALEAEAYHRWMSGNLLLEQEVWDRALEELVGVRTVYESLTKLVSEADKELCKQRLEEVEPSIRYCTYNLQRQGQGQVAVDLERASRELLDMRQSSSGAGFDMLKAKLEGVLSDTRKAQAESLTDITWLGKTAVVENDKFRESVLAAREYTYALEKATDSNVEARMALYDKTLMSYTDALSALRSAEADQAQVALAKAFVQHTSLKITIERNLELIEDYKARFKSKTALPALAGGHIVAPVDLVHLYDLLLHNLEDMLELPGAKEDSHLPIEIAARSAGFKAFRLFWVAESYAELQKRPESLALFDRCSNLCDAAVKRLQQVSEAKADLARVQELASAVRVRKCMVQTQAVLGVEEPLDKPKSKAAAAETSDAAPLLARLESYEAAAAAGSRPKLVDFPPSMEAVPAKPVLFDLAWNNVEFPDVAHRLKKKSGGLMGFFSRR
mmetsp:Transcript_32750/g.74811  ORF Transcript_32750/g.74811 Transcript_32750/m.74811 type:complete len:593 (+) Transcript_32750:2-1780(+)